MMKHHGRFPYSALPERASYDWPGGRRLAVYVAINLEHWGFGEGEGAQLTPGEPMPNVRSYSWRDYGNRVGIWYMLEMFEELGLPAVINLNSEIYEYAPQIVEPWRRRGDEIVGHGRSNGERQVRFREDDERHLIASATAAFTAHEGKPPKGWLGPYFSQSAVTPDLLKEAGYQYMLDWHCDDQPFWMKTRSGPLLNVPYPPETNDSPVIQHRMATGAEFADQIVDEVDEFLRLSEDRPLVCPIALHAFLVGRPFRLRHLRRALEYVVSKRDQLWLTRAGDIANHAASLPPGTVAGYAHAHGLEE